MTTKTTDAEEGVTITILKTGLSIPYDNFGGRVAIRGEVVHLTPENVKDTVNRFGVSWLDMTPEMQIERWGELRFMIGQPAEADGIVMGGDDPHGYRYHAWIRASEYAKKISDPAERKAALAKVAKDYPEQKTSSQWTLGTYGG